MTAEIKRLRKQVSELRRLALLAYKWGEGRTGTIEEVLDHIDMIIYSSP